MPSVWAAVTLACECRPLTFARPRQTHHLHLFARRRSPSYPQPLNFSTTRPRPSPKSAPNKPSPPSSASSRTYLLPLATLLLCYPALDFLFTHIFQIMTVTGPSMYPFLNTDYHSTNIVDRVLVDMWNPAQDLHRGTVVAFWSPLHPEKMAVKRIVALPGDTITTREPYPVKVESVPVGHVWVEGEHPEGSRKSYDSNTYGPISKSLVVGKVRGVVWPWGRAGKIRWQDWGGCDRVREGTRVERVEVFGM